jgi:hypothetical protein
MVDIKRRLLLQGERCGGRAVPRRWEKTRRWEKNNLGLPQSEQILILSDTIQEQRRNGASDRSGKTPEQRL